jgi:ketosteroid isomerase-like protein
MCAMIALLDQAAGAEPREHHDEILSFFEKYDDALMTKDLHALGAFYHPDVTVFEDGGVDRTWPVYRDEHLRAELSAYKEFSFRHVNLEIHALGPSSVLVTGEYRLKFLAARALESNGIVTHVLVKNGDRWLIRHSHTAVTSLRRPQSAR